MSITAEQISDYYQKNKTDSIHLQEFAQLEKLTMLQNDEDRWKMLRSIRSAVLKAMEGLREKGLIKHSLEAKVTIAVDPKASFAPIFNMLLADLANTVQGTNGFFEEFFIVSQFELRSDMNNLEQSEYPGLYVHIEQASGQKCPRCWQWKETVHEHNLCARCQKIV